MDIPGQNGADYLRSASTEEPLEQANRLRPGDFSAFTGQRKTVERLQVMARAAKTRGDSLNHVLLSGPPGLGKTTLAHILGSEMGVGVRVISGPVIDKPSDLAGVLTSLEEGEILFIDEIHRIPKTVEEYLYTAIEDFYIDILIDQGPNARTVRLSLPRFCLVGATTRVGLLTAPLRNRFTLQSRLEYYDRKDLLTIAQRSCRLLEMEAETDGLLEIASRARGTPRILNNLILFARDFAQERSEGHLDRKTAAAALEMLEIDNNGLDEMDKRLLRFIAENYRGGPVGLKSLAVGVGEEVQTLEDVHEPFLIQEGYLQRTAQGRMLTAKGWQTIGLPMPEGFQKNLFS
ncbi:Holliday junction branch migration DNA helicase RuvB [Puniceicoccus vermicola]|uniref:Holliday junction branch migration complex subunit RuvB n=1 Tax=Puniceicoccus vermicola TaxID=388746 RepID=A0A7X1AYS9_9BACT|nr:Holliday junction branch migration DNA helicase RuvB [Puniceicoccus vermicola]MBC2602468.1 Holliday junction branch migration DNA helicase RuvB [Puniceicoccus vermicola]